MPAGLTYSAQSAVEQDMPTSRSGRSRTTMLRRISAMRDAHGLAALLRAEGPAQRLDPQPSRAATSPSQRRRSSWRPQPVCMYHPRSVQENASPIPRGDGQPLRLELARVTRHSSQMQRLDPRFIPRHSPSTVASGNARRTLRPDRISPANELLVFLRDASPPQSSLHVPPRPVRKALHRRHTPTFPSSLASRRYPPEATRIRRHAYSPIRWSGNARRSSSHALTREDVGPVSR